jgi:hypothetical protein
LKEGKREGYGYYKSANGDSYVGYWSQGKKQGKGK